MKIEIELHCPRCQGTSIKKNGIKYDGKQNYRCKNCGRQFIGDHHLSYKGCHSQINKRILLMLSRCCGIREIAIIMGISKGKVQATLKHSDYQIIPEKLHYDCLEVDEFWTFIGSKTNKYWLQYAYDRVSGKIVAYVWGKRDAATAQKLKDRLSELSIRFERLVSDHWESFTKVFQPDRQGKFYTVGIEGNNCRLRHRIRRAVRKTCCFSKSLIYHIKAFNLGFYYINNGCV